MLQTTTYQRNWYCNRVGESYSMWPAVIILLLCASNGITQIFEGSGGDSGPTRELRFVESGNDEQIITTDERKCVRKEFRGNGFRLKGTLYSEMFICPNGLIKFNDDFYQNWPYNYGTIVEQSEDPSLSPFWARVDLSAFGTSSDDSTVRFASYHKDTNRRAVVFDKVNGDVRGFTGRSDFEATWVSVVTYENIRPHDRVQCGYEGKNTFQAVFASDETSWYLMYNYADIDWAVGVPRAEYGGHVGDAGLPVMGLNAGRRGVDYRNNEEYRNLELSGTVNVEDIDDYKGNLGMGRWIFATSPIAARSARVQCYDWFIVTSTLARNRQQCPRFERQAAFDRRFGRHDRFGRICYARVLPRRGPGLRCCYRRFGEALLANLPEPGGFLSRNPIFFNVEEDDRAFENCCVFSNLCWAYFFRRPKQNGRFYRPRRSAIGFGDPHYSNMDNMNCTFNGCGDFMFVSSDDNKFQVQVRFSQARGAGRGTVISAMALKLEGVGTIQINHIRNDGGGPPMLLHINGTEYANYDNLMNHTFIGDNVFIQRVGDDQIQLVTENGHSIVVTREPSNLVLVVTLNFGLFGSTMGLLGNWSDTMEDDFALPNGTNLGYPLTDEQIHNDFGENWRLRQDQNVIINTTADEDFFCPKDDHTPMFMSNITFHNISIQAVATSICGNNKQCVFDIAATLLPSFGQSTMNSINEFEQEKAVTENNAPTFEHDSLVFSLTVGEEFVYTVSAEDIDGDELEFISTGLPPGATAQRSANSITFRWLVNSTQTFNLSFLVQDTMNASSAFVPTINVCACQNDGLCIQQATTAEIQVLSFSQHTVLGCECVVGFTGDFCEIVRDFCLFQSGSPCHPLVNCTNSPTNYICGHCPPGYSGEGTDCADIDECEENTDDCEMMCTNIAGSFTCECMSGYRLDDNMKNCSDINECATAHDCQDICINLEGLFTCGCSENFMIPDLLNPKNCIPHTACALGHFCQQLCAVDSEGNQICSCKYVIGATQSIPMMTRNVLILMNVKFRPICAINYAKIMMVTSYAGVSKDT